jgi:ABC-type phosphate transport system substrate-binding protein
MPNPRELSQFGSFVEVDDTTKNIGIATTGTPFVGIGTLVPQEKLHVVGNLRVDGSTNIDNLTVGIATIASITNPNLTVDTLTVNNTSSLGQASATSILAVEL